MKHLFPFIFLAVAASCAKLPVDASLNKYSVNVIQDTVMFAVVGDYGDNSAQEDSVARMIKSWNPEFIITTGDNNYPLGSSSTIQNNIGKHYCDYIYNPDAPESLRCNGKATQEKVNRFFPCPGNHDNYSIPAIQPYLDFFTLPGDERNYDFTWGPVHFFSINTGKSALIGPDSEEAKWLQKAAKESNLPFKFVYFHHPPYSTGNHGSATAMRWPFQDWGVNAVFNGHEHFYLRVKDNATPNAPVYIVSGNGGNDHLYSCDANSLDTNRFSLKCDNQHWGALKVKVTATKAIIEYYTINSTIPWDTYVIDK